MRKPRLLLVLSLAALALAALGASCVHSGSTRADHIDLPEGPPALALVPADTPYAFVMLKGLDPAVTERIYRSSDHFIEQGSQEMQRLFGSDQSPAARVFASWFEEIRGHLSVEGARAMGLEPSGRMVIYGISLYPILRVEIGDAQKLRATFDRVLARAKVQLPEKRLGAQTYWQIDSDGVTVIAAIVGKEMVAGLVATKQAADFVPYVLGQKKPAHSLAETGTLRQLAQLHRFETGIVGFFDNDAIASLIMGEKQGALPMAFVAETGKLSADCKKDVHRLVGYAPRIVLGAEKMDGRDTIFDFTLETAPEIRTALASLSRPLAGLELLPAGPPLASFGIGVHLGDGIAVLRRGAAAVKAAPFACPELKDLNDAAHELDEALAKPLPPMVTSLSGVVVTLDELDTHTSPVKVSAGALIVGESAGDLVRQGLAMMAPGAANGLAADGRPVAINLAQHGIPGIEQAYVGLKSDRAALAVGEGASQRVVALLGASAPAHAPLVVFGMDLGRLSKMIPELTGKMEQTPFSFGDLYGFVSYALAADAERGVTLRFFMQMK